MVLTEPMRSPPGKMNSTELARGETHSQAEPEGQAKQKVGPRR